MTINKQLMIFMKIRIIIIQRRKEVVFDDLIADMESNKKLSPIITQLFLRGRKLNVSLVFISQSYFKVPKIIKIKCGTLFYH